MSVSSRRHWLLALWVSLLVVGCMSQIDLLQRPIADITNDVVRIVKNPIHGNAALGADGTLQVKLAPIGKDRVPGRFRTKDVVLSKINKIVASVSAVDISPPIVPIGANASGELTVTNGVIPTMTFPTLPPGKGRILTIQGFQNTTPVKGALIRRVFDVDGQPASLEVSQATTPAAKIYMSLSPTVAATTNTNDLIAKVDLMTGVSGPYPHTFSTQPALLNTGSVASTINSGTSIGSISTSGYDMAGAEVTFSFYMDANGIADPSDEPVVWCEDPATDPLPVPDHKVGMATLSVTTASTALTITPDNLVTVSFLDVSPDEDLIPWEIGVSLPDDDSPNPNPKYFASVDEGTDPQCGHTGQVTVAPADAIAGNVLTATFDFPVLDPKFVAGQIRWRDDTAAAPASIDIKASLPTYLTSVIGSTGSDHMAYVGPTTAAVPTFTLGSVTTLPIGSPVQLVGPPGVPETMRPVLGGGGKLTLTDPGQSVQDLHLAGISVAMTNGGSLQRLTVEGISGSGVSVAAIATSGTAPIVIDGAHVYGVFNQDLVTGQLVAGIDATNTGGGTITNVLVDDAFGAGETQALRYLGTPASNAHVIGIRSASATVDHSQVIRAGYIGALGITASAECYGIKVDNGAATVRFCTVSDLQADNLINGITVSGGEVSHCEVRNLNGPIGTCFGFAGITAGVGGSSDSVQIQDNNVHNLTGSAIGTALQGIVVGVPQGGVACTVTGNTLEQLSAYNLRGIDAQASGAGDEVLDVSTNRIMSCSSLNDPAAAFTGISLPSGTGLGSVTVNDNLFGLNQFYGPSTGIDANFSAATLTVNNNRFSGNDFRLGTGTSGPVESQCLNLVLSSNGAITATGNVITDTIVRHDEAGANMAFAGIRVIGNDASPTLTLHNNAIFNNDLQANQANFVGMLVHLDQVGETTVTSNRFYANHFGGANATTAIFKGYRVDTAAAGLTFDGNVVAEPELGMASADEHCVWVGNCVTGTFTHNSIYQGGASGPMTVLGDSGGAWTVANNVLACGSSGSLLAAVYADHGATTGYPGDHNTVFPWTHAYCDAPQNLPISGVADRTAALMPFVSLGNLLADHGMALDSGEATYLGSDGQPRGVGGSANLNTEPTPPAVTRPPS